MCIQFDLLEYQKSGFKWCFSVPLTYFIPGEYNGLPSAESFLALSTPVSFIKDALNCHLICYSPECIKSFTIG